jgi:hypothetical protein
MNHNYYFSAVVVLFVIASSLLINNLSAQTNYKVLKTSSVVTGGLIAGEGLALLIGMHFLSKGDNSWISPKNDILLGADLITGAGLVYLALSKDNFHQSNWFYILSSVAIISHGFREWEYFFGHHNKFCINLPLFILNNIKFAGATFITVQGLSLKLSVKF